MGRRSSSLCVTSDVSFVGSAWPLSSERSLSSSHKLKACVVGNGDTDYAIDFVDRLELPFPVYVDLGGDAYRLAGMQRNFGLRLSTIKDAWRSYQAGNRQHKTGGDVWQQGGVLVVTPEGVVLEARADKTAGEYINIPKLIEEVMGGANSPQPQGLNAVEA